MQPITARYRWTADDLLTGRKYAMRLKPWRRISLIGLAIALVAYGFNDELRANQLAANLTFFGILFAAIIVAMPLGTLLGRFIIRRQFKKRPDANMEIEWTISEQNIRVSSAKSNGEIQWSAFQKIVSTPAGFLFMPNGQIFHFLPKRAFTTPEDIESLKQFAHQSAIEFKEL